MTYSTLNRNIDNYSKFKENFIRVLDILEDILLKKRKIRKNHSPYMAKVLRKAIVKKTQHKTKYVKTKTQKDYG